MIFPPFCEDRIENPKEKCYTGQQNRSDRKTGRKDGTGKKSKTDKKDKIVRTKERIEMEKLYYVSPYIKEFEGQVVSCTEGKKGWEIVLDRTCFYPEGGGQPADTGYLGTVRVFDVHEKGENVVHYAEGPLEVGETVTGKIDWERRFRNMQEHSGEHLVSGLIHSRFGYDNVGFHMGADEVTIDFNGMIKWDELMEMRPRQTGSYGKTGRSMRTFHRRKSWKPWNTEAKRSFPAR